MKVTWMGRTVCSLYSSVPVPVTVEDGDAIWDVIVELEKLKDGTSIYRDGLTGSIITALYDLMQDMDADVEWPAQEAETVQGTTWS